MGENMNGVLLVNKQKHVTSRDVVNELTHIFNTKKIGHTGTLDPIASGVLVCTIGKYTKLNDVLTSKYKEYIATMELGYLTDTLDNTGTILSKSDNIPNEDRIKEVIYSYKKKYMQEVPIYSSVKVNGRKLYEYARNNETVELPIKEVDIKEIEILSINDREIVFKTLVSKGTYIRSLIRDIGETLGCHASMTDLIRTKQGKFYIEDTYTIDEIKDGNYKVLDIEDVLDLDIVDTSDNLYKLISNGVKIDYKSNKDFILFRYKGEDISLYQKECDKYSMFISIKA